MAVTTVREILDVGDSIGFETDGNTVIWGDARMMREGIARCGIRIGDVIDYSLDDSGRMTGFRLADESGR